MTTLSELKEKAEAATPGPWEAARMSIRVVDIRTEKDWEVLAQCYSNSKLNSDYIAACSPDVILKLIAQLEDAESTLKFCAYAPNAGDSLDLVPQYQACAKSYFKKYGEK